MGQCQIHCRSAVDEAVESIVDGVVGNIVGGVYREKLASQIPEFLSCGICET